MSLLRPQLCAVARINLGRDHGITGSRVLTVGSSEKINLGPGPPVRGPGPREKINLGRDPGLVLTGSHFSQVTRSGPQALTGGSSLFPSHVANRDARDFGESLGVLVVGFEYR